MTIVKLPNRTDTFICAFASNGGQHIAVQPPIEIGTHASRRRQGSRHETRRRAFAAPIGIAARVALENAGLVPRHAVDPARPWVIAMLLGATRCRRNAPLARWHRGYRYHIDLTFAP